jgi:hypothetical protein
MNRQFECGATASLLGSGAGLAIATNCAAVIGAAGILLAHSVTARAILLVPVMLWPLACYFSVRVAIDASLFKELALADKDSGPPREEMLDEILQQRGLAQGAPGRSISDRSQGAIRLWKRLIAITGIQVAASVAALIVEAWTR